MRRLAIVVAAGAAVAISSSAHAGKGTDFAIAKLTAAGGCKKKPQTHKAWCLASGWAKGKAAPLPKKALVGISISLSGTGEKPIVDFAAFVVDKGEVALAVWTGDDNDGHSKADAIKALTAVLEGKQKTAKLDEEVAGHVDATKTYTPDKKGGEWSWEVPQPDPFLGEHIRKVGNVWVDVSTDVKNKPNGDGSAMVTILTDAWTQ
jgi:hypothetical protein